MNKTKRTNWTGADNLDIQDEINIEYSEPEYKSTKIQKVMLHPNKMVITNEVKNDQYTPATPMSPIFYSSSGEKSQKATPFSNKILNAHYQSEDHCFESQSEEASQEIHNPIAYPRIIKPSKSVLSKLKLSKIFRKSKNKSPSKEADKSKTFRYISYFDQVRLVRSKENLERLKKSRYVYTNCTTQVPNNYKYFINQNENKKMQNFHNGKLKPLEVDSASLRTTFSPDLKARMAMTFNSPRSIEEEKNDSKISSKHASKEQKVFSRYLEDEINRQIAIKTKALTEDIVNNQLNSIENEKVKKSDFDTIKYNNQKKFFKAEEGGY